MSWQDRISPSIRFISPSGKQFAASWRGDSRKADKKLGVFNFPQVVGSFVQDQDLSAFNRPMSIYFGGPNCDLEAGAFVKACAERGEWEIIHPVKGIIFMQLVSVEEKTVPIESGNVVEIKLEWIETSEEIQSIVQGKRREVPNNAQFKHDINNQIDDLDTKIPQRLEDGVKLNTPSKITNFKTAITNAVANIDEAKKWLRTQEAKATAAYGTVQRGINVAGLEVATLAGQVQSLINLPGLIATDLRSRFDYYSNLISSMVAGIKNDANSLAVTELVVSSAFKELSRATIEASFLSRAEAVEWLENISGVYNNFNDALEIAQTDISDVSIVDQYFNQSEIFNDVVFLLATVKRYIISSIFKLATVKKFTLRRGRTPVEISITEYNSLDKIDFFIETNDLAGLEILLLPAGREVVIYL